jgi:hypothetical protein
MNVVIGRVEIGGFRTSLVNQTPCQRGKCRTDRRLNIAHLLCGRHILSGNREGRILKYASTLKDRWGVDVGGSRDCIEDVIRTPRGTPVDLECYRSQ